MKKCCGNCRRRLDLETWDYSKIGSGNWKVKEPGFACLAFADEGLAIHIVGLAPDRDWCEMFSPKGGLK